MSNLKWTRKEPGHYVSGTWHVKGAGTNWDLYDGRKHIHSCKSKKECTQIAEDPKALKEEEPEDDQPVVSSKKVSKPTDLDSVLASLRLSIDDLALRIASFDDSNRRLTEAIIILGKHVAKLNKGK